MVGNLVLCALRHVAELLNREGINWAIAGGVALSFWDHGRNTKDADFLIGVDDRNVEDMLATFQSLGLRPKRVPPIITVGKQRFAQYMYQLPDAAALLRANREVIDFPLLRSECERLELRVELTQVWNEAFPDTNMPGADA